MKAAHLRKAILQAAVQGKLVSQNSNDEPASELLKQIQAEKNQLITDKKIKEEKPLPAIKEDEIPYVLPEGWEWCRLNDITQKIGAGSTPTGGREVYISAGYKFIRSQNVYNQGLRLENVAYIPAKIFTKMQGSQVYPNDILLNITGGSIGRSSLIPSSFDTGNVNQHVMIIRSLLFLINDFLHIAIISPYIQELIMLEQVGAREGLSATKLKSFVFPLPPLAEQKRIVAKVEELMKLCDELEAAEQELDSLEKHFLEYLPKSILQAAVQGKLVSQNSNDEPASELLKQIQAGKNKLITVKKIKEEKLLPAIKEDEIPYALPEGWEWCRIGSLSQTNPRNNIPDKTEVAFLPMALISKDYFGGHQQEKRLWEETKKGFTHFADGDVLLAKITPCFENGKSCIALNLLSGYGAGTTELHVFRCIIAFSQYLLLFFKSPFFLTEAEVNMTGTAGQKRIPVEYIRKFLLPLPPLAEQKRIVAKVEELMSMCEELKKAYTIEAKQAVDELLEEMK